MTLRVRATSSLVVLALLLIPVRTAQALDDGLGDDLLRERPGATSTVPGIAAPDASGEQDRARSRLGFEVALTLPFLLTDNAGAASDRSDGDRSGGNRRSDLHAMPDLLLHWSRQFGAVKLSADLDATLDRYATATEEDFDNLSWGLTAIFGGETAELFVPYLSYDASADFEPGFRRRDPALHDLSAGVSSGIAFDRDGDRIAVRDATQPGSLSLSLDLRLTRRLDEAGSDSSRFVTATLDALAVLAEDWSLGVTPRVRYRRYDEESRRDVRLGAALRLVWTPDWLTRLVEDAEIGFVVEWLRNLSTDPQERFSQWEGGPSLLLSWRF